VDERIIIRYSECFKRSVVEALESGRFVSLGAAQRHYGIPGMSTIPGWLRRYGKNHLQAKVVRVEKPDEADRVRELQDKVAQLERALGRAQVQHFLEEEFLKRACQRLGEDVESFKKKNAGGSSTPPPTSR